VSATGDSLPAGGAPAAHGGARGGRRLVIGHLFADLLNLYGDRGNVAALVRRATWRGIDVELRTIGPDDADLLRSVEIAFIGGGQDAQQVGVAHGLERLGPTLAEAVTAGTALLAVCGGYQNLGHRYRSDLVGELHGPGLLDVRTEAPPGSPRRVGGVVIALDPGSPIAEQGRASAAAAGRPGAEMRLVGFENHSGLTTLGADARPLGHVEVGWGNNARDAGEGIVAHPGDGGRAGLRVGTYLHGPLLPRNPHLADYILACALAGSGQDPSLEPLPDDAEWTAHAAFEDRWRGEWERSRALGGSRMGRLRERLENLVGF
jgi:CobQ-like glutamine amidotransferase family enzyme